MMMSPLLVFLSLALCTSIISCSFAKGSTSPDSLPITASSYEGYRLSITEISIKKKKKKSATIQYNLINTGRNFIDTKIFRIDNIAILFEFDHSLKANELDAYKHEIISKILKENLKLTAGQAMNKRSMKLPFKKASEEETAFTIDVGNSSSSSPDRYFDKNYCPDLHIDTIKIIKLTKKWLTIEYTISNTGKGPASLSGDTNDKNDNLFIRAHLSGAKRLSRGAVAVGGSYITDRNVLEAGDSYIGIIRIDIKKRTRYTSNLILELDPYSSVRECDETNNQRFIFVEWWGVKSRRSA